MKHCLGDNFQNLARAYLLDGFRKGLPSLFSDVKGLYTNPAKLQAVEELVLEMKQDEALAPRPSAPNDSSALPESPTTYLWILYFLAQHYSHTRRYSEALDILNEAITHTPTLPELYTCKGRVLKRAGDLIGAVQCLEEARLLDKQDRFLNTKSAKYHLRAGLSEEAQPILGLFTKVGYMFKFLGRLILRLRLY